MGPFLQLTNNPSPTILKLFHKSLPRPFIVTADTMDVSICNLKVPFQPTVIITTLFQRFWKRITESSLKSLRDFNLQYPILVFSADFTPSRSSLVHRNTAFPLLKYLVVPLNCRESSILMRNMTVTAGSQLSQHRLI